MPGVFKHKAEQWPPKPLAEYTRRELVSHAAITVVIQGGLCALAVWLAFDPNYPVMFRVGAGIVAVALLVSTIVECIRIGREWARRSSKANPSPPDPSR